MTKPSNTHPYRGELLTVPALARLAGCSPAAMRKRLMKGSAEEAVAMGGPDRRRKKRLTEPAPAPGSRAIRTGVVFVAPGVTRHLTGVAP